MIDHQYKCIFIHINKCGGTTLDRLFKANARGHKSILSYQKAYPKKFDSYFKFSFTRNPWDKMVSFYHYHVRRGWPFNWDWNKNNAPNFEDFIKIIHTYSEEKEKKIWPKKQIRKHKTTTMRMSNHLDWLCSDSGEILVDFIGKLENFQSDFDQVCDKIGMPRRNLPHKNKSKHKHYRTYYNDETIQIVAERFSKDIDYFGYQF